MPSSERTFTRREILEQKLLAIYRNALVETPPEARPEVEKWLRELYGNDPNELETRAKALREATTPVNMQTFIEDPLYLGLKGQVYPRVFDMLVEIDEGDYTEVILTGGIGWGKSYAADILLLRMAYLAGCLQNPQRQYNLTEGFPVVFVMQSLTKRHAQKVLFEGASALLKRSEYFNRDMPYDRAIKSEIRFANGIRIEPVAGNESGAIGQNVMGAVMDEVNFMAVVNNSLRRPWEATYDVAQTNYLTLARRMKSRFMLKGKLPGKLILVSSKRYPDDFTERRMAEVMNGKDPQVYVADFAQWETKPAGTYLGPTFRVYVAATMADQSRILDDIEVPTGDGEIVQPPVEFRKEFDNDLDSAIREIAGRTTQAVNRFIRRGDMIRAALSLRFQHPFSKTRTTLRDGIQILPNLLHQDVLAPRAVHLDLAVKQDACGLVMGYVQGWQEVERTAIDVARLDEESPQGQYTIRETPEGRRYVTLLPLIKIEAMLQIYAAQGDEIVIPEVVELVLKLREFVPIKWATADSYQSVAPLQMLKQQGILTDILSVDVKPQPYNELRAALYDRRLEMYSYQPVLEELQALERNEKTGRVDHPAYMRSMSGERIRGSKDVADGLAGVSYVLMRRRESWGETVPMRRTRPVTQRSRVIRGGSR